MGVRSSYQNPALSHLYAFLKKIYRKKFGSEVSQGQRVQKTYIKKEKKWAKRKTAVAGFSIIPEKSQELSEIYISV